MFWRRWGEALIEAGFTPNKFVGPIEEAVVLEHYLKLVSRLNAIPVHADLLLERRRNPDFPSESGFRRIGDKKALLKRAAALCNGRDDFDAVRRLLLKEVGTPLPATRTRTSAVVTGYVYLIRSGKSYKIGRTNASGRRERELAIQLPTKPQTIHIIQTDDPDGIEAYWHRRFAAKRQDGEWFLLSDEDVRAFKWRRYQ